MISYFLFLFNFIVHYFYIFIFLEPQKYIRYLPGHNYNRAMSFARGESIFYPDVWSSFYFFVGSLYKILMTLNLIDIKIYVLVIINLLLSSISVVYIYRISKNIFSRNIALITSLIYIFYYPTIYLNSLIMSENLFIPFLLAFIYYYLFKFKGISKLLSGFYLGIALLCRPILFPFIPFLILWSVLFKKGKQLFVLIPTIIILIVAGLINQKVSTDHIFSVGTNGGVNFAMTQCRFKKLQYNGPKKLKFYFTPPIFWNTNNPEKHSTVPFTNQAYYYQMGLKCLIDHPDRLLSNLVYIKNIFYSLYYPDIPKDNLHKTQLVVWKWVGMVSYLLFLTYFFVKQQKKHISYYVFFVFLFSSLILAVYFANPGEERYLSSYYFALVLYAVPTLITLFKRISLDQSVHRMKSIINQLRRVAIRKKESA